MPRRCSRVPLTLVLLIALVTLTLVGGAPLPLAAHAPDVVAAAVADSAPPVFLTDGAHLGGITLRLAALGRGDTLAPVEQVIPTDNGTRAVYAHGDVTEWYVRQGGGVEQGITLAAPPAGDGPLALTIATPAAIALVDVDGGGSTLILPRASGESGQWRYNGLQVTDAAGRVLPSHLASTDSGVRIVVDDNDAVYPVTVDPFVQGQALAVSGTGQFGVSVALSGDGSTALIGANSTNGSVGTAYIYTRGTSGYMQGQTLAVTGTGTFGISVALSGDGSTALVGANNTNGGVGTAYVFTRGSAGYSQFGPTLAVSGTTYFGLAVALSGDGSTALIGAYGTNLSAGTAYVFTRGSTSYSQFGGTLAVSGTGQFGLAVALSGDGSTALVGANTTNSNAGVAYVFTRGSTSYTQFGPTLAVSGTGSFGVSVSLSADGGTALVGAYVFNGGTAYVFTRGSTGYSQFGPTLAVSSTSQFGLAVSLSGDGSTALIGAYGTNSFAGTAYVFTGLTSIVPAPGTAPQRAAVTTAFAAPLAAVVRDGVGNAIAGASVTFAAPAGGPSGTFACLAGGCPAGTSVSPGGLTATMTTDNTGRATAPAFTANSAAGGYTVTATTDGGSGNNNPPSPTAFYLTNMAGVPASITVVSGGNGSAVLGQPFAAPLRVRVFDNEGNTVAGATVTFTAPTGTNVPTVTLPNGGVAPPTDPSGYTALTATAFSRPGVFNVTASVSGVAAPASFTLTNTANANTVLVTGFSPPTGPITGGTVVTLQGTNFGATATVSFGGVAVSAANISVNQMAGTITVTAPVASAPATVDISVTTNGQTATIHGYTYLNTGAIAAQPGTHPVAGGGSGGGSSPMAQPARHDDAGNAGGSGAAPNTASPVPTRAPPPPVMPAPQPARH